MSTTLFSPLLECALRRAAMAHQLQFRKGDRRLPYISHPAGVALILLRAGFQEDEILAAALLHDVVEDTDVTADQLAAEFCDDAIVQIVLGLSEQKFDVDGQPRAWEVRKQEHLAHIAEAPIALRAVLLADKLHNLGSMLYDIKHRTEPVDWKIFNRPSRIAWYYDQMLAVPTDDDPRLAILATEARRLLEELRPQLPPQEADPT